MLHMPDEHVDQSPGADGVSAGGANFGEGRGAHILDGECVCAAQKGKFVEQIGKGEFICFGFADVVILLKAGEGSLILSGNSQ